MVFHIGCEEGEVPNQWLSVHSFDSGEKHVAFMPLRSPGNVAGISVTVS